MCEHTEAVKELHENLEKVGEKVEEQSRVTQQQQSQQKEEVQKLNEKVERATNELKKLMQHASDLSEDTKLNFKQVKEKLVLEMTKAC